MTRGEAGEGRGGEGKRGEGRGREGTRVVGLPVCVCGPHLCCRGHAAFNTAIQMLNNNSVIGGGLVYQ